MGLENIKIRFGKYKGKQLSEIPNEYLKFLYDKGILKGKIKFYIQQKLNLPKSEFKVKVTDSLGQDGIYKILAWNEKHAISETKRQFGIQITQSFHGTLFEVNTLN